jgi:vacuolar iron transporter family protein
MAISTRRCVLEALISPVTVPRYPELLYRQRFGHLDSIPDVLSTPTIRTNPVAEPDPQQRYAANLQGEVDAAALYRTLSRTEKNPDLAQVYARLAAVEEAHAEFWKRQIMALGRRVPMLRPGFRTRALEWLARRFGPAFVLPTVNTLEQMDSGAYAVQPEAVAGGLPAAERSHARILEALANPSPTGLTGATLARLEGRHRGMGGNALRASVLGANDGLVSNLSLVMGVAGADMAAHAILVTGLAGLLAGSCSMALGEWLSVNTARESARRQIATEASELEQVPEEEQEELVLIYQAKGLPEDLAKTLAERLISNKKTALDTLVREELGIDPNELGGSAWVAAGTSFMLFAIGAIFPVAPYFGLSGIAALAVSLAASGAALFMIGAGTSLFTGRGVWFSGTRQLLIGLAAAGVTFGIGRLIGVAMTG